MPIYEYECCGDIEEHILPFSALPPKCSCGKRMRKIISPLAKAIVLEGWDDDIQDYVTGPRDRAKKMAKKGLVEGYARPDNYGTSKPTKRKRKTIEEVVSRI